jgi:ribosomal protein S27E
MADREIREYTCPECGTFRTYEFSGCGSYASMFDSGDWTTVTCNKCGHILDTVKEY